MLQFNIKTSKCFIVIQQFAAELKKDLSNSRYKDYQ